MSRRGKSKQIVKYVLDDADIPEEEKRDYFLFREWNRYRNDMHHAGLRPMRWEAWYDQNANNGNPIERAQQEYQHWKDRLIQISKTGAVMNLPAISDKEVEILERLQVAKTGLNLPGIAMMSLDESEACGMLVVRGFATCAIHNIEDDMRRARLELAAITDLHQRQLADLAISINNAMSEAVLHGRKNFLVYAITDSGQRFLDAMNRGYSTQTVKRELDNLLPKLRELLNESIQESKRADEGN